MTPYYSRNGITIYCGETIEIMSQLDCTLDGIFADLPYGTTACSWDEVIPFEPLWTQYKRLIKERGAVVLTGSQPFTSKLVISNLEWFKYAIIWDKVIQTGFLDANKRPMRQHEEVLLFCDGSPTYNPQKTTGEPYTKKRVNDRTKPKAYGAFVSMDGISTGNRYPTSIIKISNANRNKTGHPTQKPVALFAYLIRTYTNPGELIMDNTMGSGTTLVAAQNEGRRAIGIDISEEYCQIAVDRLRQPSFFSIPDEPEDGPEQLKF